VRLKPAPLAALGLALAALVAALAVGNWALSTLVVALPALVVAGLLVPTPRVVSVTRRGFERHAWTGEQVEVEVEAEVEGIGLVALYDTFPNEFELFKGNTYRLFWVFGRAKKTYTYTLACWKRGAYQIAPTRWRAWHGMYMKGEVHGNGGNAMVMDVMPKPAALPYLVLTRGRTRLPPVGSMLTKIGVSNTDFRDVRSYSPGDPLKSINWKATARRLSAGSTVPLTNQYESEGRRTAWLFVDSSAYMTTGNNLQNPMEVLVHLAVGASSYFLRRGYRMGLYPFGGDVAPIYPGAGRSQLLRVSAAMRDVRPARKAEGLSDAVEGVKADLVRDSASTVIFARLDPPDPDALITGVKKLVNLGPRIRARSMPLVVGVGGYLFIDADDWYQRNSVLLMDMDTRALVRELRRLGVRVMEWRPPDQPDWSTVAQSQAREAAGV